MSVVDKIKHYQRNIEKCDDNEDRILHCISKLSNLPVTVQHLQETGVGRTVNALRKYDGGIGDAAKALVAKWKAMVANEESSEGEGEGEDEDEACVPDAPESYSDSRESVKSEESTLRHKNLDNKTPIHKHKSEKSEILYTSHNHKHSSKHDQKEKISQSSSKSSSDVDKNLSSGIEKQKKHDKDRHIQKYESKSDSKSSKDNASKKAEAHGSKHHSQSSCHASEKYANRSMYNSNSSKMIEENDRKRKHDDSSGTKKESKRRKHVESESDKYKSHESDNTDKHDASTHAHAASKVKEQIKNKDMLNKIEIKPDKRDSLEKAKENSSKLGSDLSSNKSKHTVEKHKHKSEKHNDHSRRSSTNQDVSESKNHSSSSSDKHNDKSRDRSNKNVQKDGKHKSESKSSSDSKHAKHVSKESKNLVKMKQINGDEGIDCQSGASFAEALGMCTMAQPSKKRSNISPNTSTAKNIKSEQSSTNSKKTITKCEPTTDPLQTPSLLTSNAKLEPLSVDLASTLPEISPNYKPLPYVNLIQRKEEDKALTDVIYMKNQRTKVYSGNKSGYTSVPTLFDICTRVLIENIDALEFTGGVPFEIIKPVLERATADQLFMLEHYNPYLIDDTDSLWQFHCNREFRNKQREEMETWREMYMRCLDEREAKLKTLTANIKQSIDKSVPVRSTKLAYVDNVVKPPRNILKKQAKYGTANSVPNTASSLKQKLISGGGPTAATNISVPSPLVPRGKSSAGVMKKTKAPLMAKALQLIKGRYKR